MNPNNNIFRDNLSDDIFFDPARKRAHNRRLFTVVVPRYDLVTRVLSFGRDRAWKRRLIAELPPAPPGAPGGSGAGTSPAPRETGAPRETPPPLVLDLACGTGDLTFALAERYPQAEVTGLDLNPEMLDFARRRAAASSPASVSSADPVPSFREGDMQDLPFADGSVWVVTGAYAVRNAPDLRATLAEIRRVLRPDGQLALLEFSHSARRRVSALQLGLLRFWGRLWGRILHRDAEVYGYIADSLAAFPHLDALEHALREAGFTEVRSRRYMFGLLAITRAGG